MAAASQHFGKLEAGNQNSISQGIFIQNAAPLPSALDRRQFRHGNPPPLNRNFLGREDEIKRIKAAFQEAEAGKQKRYVIYGMAGIGKSEICVKLIHDMQSQFWGVFWVDVSDFASAEGDFKNIADQIRPGTAHQTLGHALSALAEVDFNTHPWLLVLDNADERREDYARLFPSAPGGSILLTSRNHECAIHETVGCCELESVTFKDSVLLLLKAAKVRQRDWELYLPQAETIAELLGSHTLTLVQAGAFISRDPRHWNEYPRRFNENRHHLLAISWNQAQSKYGNVYATFEVSARTLESDESTEAKDALCLLEIFAMFHHSGLPTFVFEDASKVLTYAKKNGYSNDVREISADLANLLPEFLSEQRTSPLRFQAGLYCLEALSFIKQANMDDQDGVRLVSMHPLAHSWAKDRLDERTKEQAWMMTGSIIALSAKRVPQDPHFPGYTMWRLHSRQLQSHLSSFLDSRGSCRSQCLCALEHIQIYYAISRLLGDFSLYREQEIFLFELFWSINAEPSRPENVDLLPLYREMAYTWMHLEKYPASIYLWKKIILLQEATSVPEVDLLDSQYGLAAGYSRNGETTKAIAQLENIVSIEKGLFPAEENKYLASQREIGRAYLAGDQVERAIGILEHVVQMCRKTLPESSEIQLVSEHDLGYAYLNDGQVERAIKLLEHVVQIQQRTLLESSSGRLASEHTLGVAYCQTSRLEEALQLFEHVARIERATLHPADPSRLVTLRYLSGLYIKTEQPEKAKEVAVEFDNALRSLPMDDARWREYGEWLADRKQYFGIQDGPPALSEYDPDPGSDAPPDSTNAEYGSGDESDAPPGSTNAQHESGNESDAGLGTQDAEYECEVDEKHPRWKRWAKRILKRDKRKE